VYINDIYYFRLEERRWVQGDAFFSLLDILGRVMDQYRKQYPLHVSGYTLMRLVIRKGVFQQLDLKVKS
jgi:hypothetical protein